MKLNWALLFLLIILLSNFNKVESNIFQGVTDYISNVYSGWKQDVVQSTKGYKDLLNTIYDFFRTFENNIYDKVNDNENIIGKLKNILNVIYDTSNEKAKEQETNESEKDSNKPFGYDFQQFYNSIDFLAFFENSKSQGEQFFDGFMEGISSVPFEQNKCNSEIKEYKSEIVSVFEKVINSFQTGENLIQEILNLYELIKKLGLTTKNCDLHLLTAEIVNLTNTFGVAKLAYRVFVNRKDLFYNISEVYQKINSQETKVAGRSFGKVVKILFNYSTK